MKFFFSQKSTVFQTIWKRKVQSISKDQKNNDELVSIQFVMDNIWNAVKQELVDLMEKTQSGQLLIHMQYYI